MNQSVVVIFMVVVVHDSGQHCYKDLNVSMVVGLQSVGIASSPRPIVCL